MFIISILSEAIHDFAAATIISISVVIPMCFIGYKISPRFRKWITTQD